MKPTLLWYIPNEVHSGHRGDAAAVDHNSLETLAGQARALEDSGWQGALIGAGWGRPDTFTLSAALTACTKTFEPLMAIRPGYWQPAQFASSAATLDHLSGGRVRVNIVSGVDNLAAYGDTEASSAQRYGRTREFMRLVRRLWTEENVTFEGEYFNVKGSTAQPRIHARADRPHPPLYFGGASEAAERTAATDADIQLFWGEPLDGVRERIDRLKTLSRELDRDLPPLEFGLRVTTLVRDTSVQAWADAEERVVKMAKASGAGWNGHQFEASSGQQRLVALQSRGDVLDSNLYTAPAKFGGGGAGATWLVGSAAEVAASLRKYQELGITHFILSDTPYLTEIKRQGEQLLPLLRG